MPMKIGVTYIKVIPCNYAKSGDGKRDNPLQKGMKPIKTKDRKVNLVRVKTANQDFIDMESHGGGDSPLGVRKTSR